MEISFVGSGLGTILTSSELPVVVTMSSLVLGEAISWPQWIGVIIILYGIVNSNIRFRSYRSAKSYM
ncbi:EamA family transporter [Paenibacillus sp. 2KB_20]